MRHSTKADGQRPTTDEPQNAPWSSVVGRRSSYLLPILLLAFILRLLIWAGPLHQLANDEIEYVAVARDLLAGRGWVFYDHYHWLRAPLYNLFLAGSLWLAGGDLHAAALPNIALSIANVYLSYRLALRFVGRRAAALAAVITAVLWTNITFASLYMAETLFTFCFLAGMLFLVEQDGERTESREPRTESREPRTENREPRTENREPRTENREQSARLLVFLPPYLLVALSGVFFGLATLTRSATLLFLPIIALWLLFRPTTDNRRTYILQPSSIVLPLVFLVAAVLTVAPWTIRNYVAYNRLIPVETGLSYNLWAFNEPRESLGQIHRTLDQISNPADRSDYATQQGLARLREDPGIVLRKLWPNWLYLTRIKPIEDRFVLESYYRDVRLPQFSAALLLDDMLYLVIALAGTVGLAWGRESEVGDQEKQREEEKRRRGEGEKGRLRPSDFGLSSLVFRLSKTNANKQRTISILWLSYIISTMLLTHGEARYRHFLFPVLIPYAAWALIQLGRKGEGEKGNTRSFPLSWPRLLILSCCLLVFLPFISTYPYSWAGQNLLRGWQQTLGDIAAAAGNNEAQLGFYQNAAKQSSSADASLRFGDLARRAGRLDEAEAAYRESFRQARLWVAPNASLGDLLRSQGRDDEARTAFNGFYADEGAMLDWSWQHLQPTPRAAIDIGDGLDFGYVAGMYAAETQQGASARWTNGRAMVRLDMPPGTTALRLRLAAPHPNNADVHATVCVAEHCSTFRVDRTWRNYTLQLPTNMANRPIEIRSPTFDGGDGRTLGILIDEARVE